MQSRMIGLGKNVARLIPGQGRPPFLLRVRSSKLFITITVCIAVFTVRRGLWNIQLYANVLGRMSFCTALLSQSFLCP